MNRRVFHRMGLEGINTVRTGEVVVKLEQKKQIAATVHLSSAGHLSLVTPEKPDPQSTTGAVRIPARSAAVLLEL